ncbi:MAG: hypothetical protein JWM33_1607 [Caulobacteraceae bacterium]|nr:hypothetical protein [Caulobacteraceae bacterium]
MDLLPPPIAHVAPSEAPTVRQLLNVVLATVLVAALYVGREILIPITLAVLLAFVLAPLVALLRRLRLPRAPAVLAAVVLSLCAVVGVGFMVGSQVSALGQDLPKYQATITAKLAQVSSLTNGTIDQITARLTPKAPPPRRVGRAAVVAAGPVTGATPVEIVKAPPTPLEVAQKYFGPILRPFAMGGLVFVLAVFILLQQADLRDRLIRLVGSSDLHRTTVAMDDAAARLSRYFVAQLGVNAGFGLVIGVGLQVIGLPHALLWGVLAALLRFIPFVGTFVSLALTGALAAAVDPGWRLLAMTLGLFAVAETVTNQAVEPFLYGRSTGLSPVSMVVAAVFWTWLWGPLGLFLSTPLSLCLLVLGRHVPRLEFIDVILGDRPALTPAQSFYQRILAGDSDEVLQQADLLLKDSRLTDYYDQVAIKALLLAATDAQRRTLKRDQVGIVRTAVELIITELADYPDAVETAAPVSPAASPTDPADPVAGAPPTHMRAIGDAPAGRPMAILCVAGPGVLDELVALMLGQLLKKHGLTAVHAPYRDASPDTIQRLDFEGVGGVCVCHLYVGGGVNRLRFMVDRLARRLDARGPLLVLAPTAQPDMRGSSAEEPLSSAIGTLREALESCVAASREHGAG